MANLTGYRAIVERCLLRGYVQKPPPATVVDHDDYTFISELRNRGESTSAMAEILYVTEDAIREALRKMDGL
jgi:hypothetical protein